MNLFIFEVQLVQFLKTGIIFGCFALLIFQKHMSDKNGCRNKKINNTCFSLNITQKCSCTNMQDAKNIDSMKNKCMIHSKKNR